MNPVWIYFSAGRGPAECRIAVETLVAQFRQECGGVVADFVEDRDGHGWLSALVEVDSDAPYQRWIGTVEWVCRSRLRPHHGRKRWYISASAFVPPAANDPAVRPEDLVWESLKASGPGGQHVNKTESAVRLSHRPTGLVVTAREERSQHRNRSLALGKLAALLQVGIKADRSQTEQDMWRRHDELVRGNPVLTFVGEDLRPG